MAEKGADVITLSSTAGRSFQKAKLMWKIQDFKKMLAYSKAAGESELQSETFVIRIPTQSAEPKESIGRLNFHIELEWNHPEEESEEEGETQEESDRCKSFGMFLRFFPKNSSSDEVTLTYSFSILSAKDGNLWNRFTSAEPRKFFAEHSSWGWMAFLSKELLAENKEWIDKEGALTVVCEMEIMCRQLIQSKKNSRRKKNTSLNQPIHLGEELSMAKESKDVTLICAYRDELESKKKHMGEDEEKKYSILCHKLILATRSDVFKAMFSHGQTSESQTSTIIIEDTPLDVLQAFVDYLYMDKSDFLTSDDIEAIGGMLRLAEKYNVQSLKQRCEDSLLQLIKGSTLEDIYLLAYFFNCEPVAKAVASYVADNFDEAFKSGWMDNFTQGMQDKIMKDIWAHKFKVLGK